MAGVIDTERYVLIFWAERDPHPSHYIFTVKLKFAI